MSLTALSSWIDPIHLDEASLGAYHTLFRDDPFRLIVIKNLLRPNRAKCLLDYLAKEASYQTIYVLKADQNAAGTPTRGKHVDEAQWTSAPAEGRLFRLDLARSPTKPTVAGITFLECVGLIEEGPFRHFLTRLVGEELGAIGFEAHRMQAGDFIALHSDDRARRRLGFIIYLSQPQSDDGGGELVFKGVDGTERAFVPEFNSLLLFDVAGHVGHRVEMVTDSAPRLSLHGWCLMPDAT
jgi:hypothetical protein